MRQAISAVIKTTVALDHDEVKKALEKLCITVESVHIGKPAPEAKAEGMIHR
jgi:hypothetical protein